MTIADVTARISEIQTQIDQLGPTTPTDSTAAAFATTLDATTGTTGASDATSTSSTGGSITGADVVADAKKYLGVPYKWGGTDPVNGMDCSGLVYQVYNRDLGFTNVPRNGYQQPTVGTAVPSLAQAQPGDILAFGSPVHHLAIYVGDGKMIDEPHTGAACRIEDVWPEGPTAIRRVIGSGTGTTSPTAPSTAVSTSGTSGVSTAIPYANLINAAAARTGVPANLLAAVAKQESGFNAGAVSPVGAQGLMQLMPGTAKGLGVTNSFDPTQAIDGGARLLKGLLDKFGGRVDLALAGYNAGAGAVLRYNGIPPYPETQRYVKNIMAMMQNGVGQ